MNHYKYYDYYQLSNQLLEFHELFYKFWTVGRPVFTEQIPTACVCFDSKSGKFLQFLFNPHFWDKLDNYERCFIIAHECLHVILNHGIRGHAGDKGITAIAIDIITNYILTNNLGLKLTPMLLEGTHFQTIFKDHTTIPKNKSFEYYYNLIKNQPELLQDGVDEMIQNHDYLYSLNIDALLDHIFGNQDLDKDQKKELKDKLKQELAKAGTESLDKLLDILESPKLKTSFRWEQLMRNMVKTKYSIYMREFEGPNWIKEDRRMATLDEELMTPLWLNEKPDYKFDLWFFQDVSGSCEHLASKFLAVAKSIPDKIFDVKFHTFDTSVREVDLKKSKIRGGGGTAFDIIHNFILKEIEKNQIKYPSNCVVITDGEGNQFDAGKFNRNFLWILTGNNKSCIPKECRTILMDEI